MKNEDKKEIETMPLLSDEEKNSLSAEEIAAIDGSDGQGEESTDQKEEEKEEEKEIKPEAKDKQDSEDESDAEEKEGSEGDDDDAVEDKKDSEVDDKTAEAEDIKPENRPDQPFIPKFADVDQEKLNDLEVKLKDAKEKFDDGEIDYATLDEIKDEYNQAKWKAEFAEEANKTIRESRWQWEQERFFSDNSMYKENATLNAAFCATVNRLIASDEGVSMSDHELLTKARATVDADLGIVTKNVSSRTDHQKAKATAKDDALKKAKEKNADRSEIPSEIGGLPAADNNDEPGEFAYLDKLEGEKYQDAIDKLTPAQLERYENS